MLLSSLHATSFIRLLAGFRRRAPAVQLALSVSLGQILLWFVGTEIWATLSVLFLGLLLNIRALRGYSWLFGGVLVGVLSAYILTNSFLASEPLVGELSIFGVVADTPRHPRPGEVTFELRATGEARDLKLIRCRAVELPWRNAAYLKPGDAVWISGVFSPVAKPLNPFSWQGWLWRRGITSECKARFVSLPAYQQTPFLYDLREKLREWVFNKIGESQGSALILSMALGYHDILSVPLEKAFTRLGLTHLLVVSGYQVSLMFGFILFCFARLIGFVRSGGHYLRSLMTLAAFGFASLYVLFIGAEMSAIRAILAAACASAHLLSERETSFSQRWGVALLGMQLIWPWCVFDIGVALTFAALFGIGLGADIGHSSKRSQFVWVTFVVWLCTGAIILGWQGTISPLGLLLNLILAAPWSIINCTAGLCALCLGLIHTPGALYLLKGIAWLNEILGEVVLYLGESRLGGWQFEGLSKVCATAAVIIALALVSRAGFVTVRVRSG
jgi:ComEC/Rec2-related protein